jgi:hypothetical protein
MENLKGNDMTEDALLILKATRLNAAIARALIRMEGMRAENAQRKHRGESMAYAEHHFDGVIESEGIDCNTVQKELFGG